MNTMLYKGYSAHIEFDEGDRIFVGHLAGIRDIVGFHGSSVDASRATPQLVYSQARHSLQSLTHGFAACDIGRI